MHNYCELYSYWISTKRSIRQGVIWFLIRTKFLDFVWHWQHICVSRLSARIKVSVTQGISTLDSTGLSFAFSSLLWHESHKLASDQVKNCSKVNYLHPALMWLVEVKPLYHFLGTLSRYFWDILDINWAQFTPKSWIIWSYIICFTFKCVTFGQYLNWHFMNTKLVK